MTRWINGHWPSLGGDIRWMNISRVVIRRKKRTGGPVVDDVMFISNVVSGISGVRNERRICRSGVLNRSVIRCSLKTKPYQRSELVMWNESDAPVFGFLMIFFL